MPCWRPNKTVTMIGRENLKATLKEKKMNAMKRNGQENLEYLLELNFPTTSDLQEERKKYHYIPIHLPLLIYWHSSKSSV